WNRMTMEIRSGELPQQFTTSSNVLLIANSWLSSNPDVAAVEDRGRLLYFSPPNADIHRYARGLPVDEEVYQFVDEHLSLMGERFSLRTYLNAAQLKRTDEREGTQTWRQHVLGHALDEQGRLAMGLLRDPSFANDAQRAREFAR